jgi:asparagine synthase (glutamine-hydrolysing)
MPALKYVRGPFLELMRDVLASRASRERGLYRQTYLDQLLAAPDMHHTRIQGNKLWHLALLELWLQRNVDGSIEGRMHARTRPAGETEMTPPRFGVA